MFHLIWLFVKISIYIVYWFVKIIAYILTLVISLVTAIFLNNSKKEHKLEEENYEVKNYYEKLDYNYNKKEKYKIVRKEEYGITQITDTELKVTTEKIQELYKELGFNVKVIDIIKKKYITEYEVIFPNTITQFDILSVSNKIIYEFQIDGVRIVRNNKKDNRIYIQIPLKYVKTLT